MEQRRLKGANVSQAQTLWKKASPIQDLSIPKDPPNVSSPSGSEKMLKRNRGNRGKLLTQDFRYQNDQVRILMEYLLVPDTV